MALTKHSSILTSKPYSGSGTGRRLLANVEYRLKLYDSNGIIRWSDVVQGTVVIAGLNKLLDATFKTGLSSPAWYVGLLDGATAPVITATDTMANHAGWSENIGVSNSTRPALTLGIITSGAVNNSASLAVFNINAKGFIGGPFITDSATVGGNTGVLYDAGLFLDGIREVYVGDVLQVESILSIGASA